MTHHRHSSNKDRAELIINTRDVVMALRKITQEGVMEESKLEGQETKTITRNVKHCELTWRIKIICTNNKQITITQNQKTNFEK